MKAKREKPSSESPVLHVTKLEAARRQLGVAIRLYFHDVDPVSQHTLAAAAYNVLMDVNSARGGARMLMKEVIVDILKPEYAGEFIAALKEPENFFKHANRDPHATLEFRPEQTGFLLWEACVKYYELAGEQTVEHVVFRTWFEARNAEAFKDDTPAYASRVKIREAYAPTSKAKFFSDFLPMAERLQVKP